MSDEESLLKIHDIHVHLPTSNEQANRRDACLQLTKKEVHITELGYGLFR
jgi:hypothetical protein